VFWIAPELGAQRLVLRAAAAPGAQRVTFEIDGAVVGVVPAPDPWIAWELKIGRHVLRVSAPGIPPVVASFEVKR
jgi:hypothetical protein